jgi:hypothetical protein
MAISYLVWEVEPLRILAIDFEQYKEARTANA